ncbi:MAG: CrcB family protein [Actinomycetota bacterium]|nr:CrcB family protein [Actinomycetota bacterium]
MRTAAVAMTTVFVALAGAVGAVLRYGIGLAVGMRTFPWATLAINVSGSFALALVLAGPASSRWSTSVTTAMTVGLLGAYTTFSTFGYETFTLLRTDRVATAASYVALSVVGGLVATALGYVAGRAVA